MTPALFSSTARVPLKPFAGTLGVAPAEPGLHSVVPPRRVGGNLDIRDLTAGVSLYLPIEVANKFFRLFQSVADLTEQKQPQPHLTDREKEVLYWLTQGASNQQISQQLYVTVATVKAHLTSVFEKLNVTSRTQAIVAAVKLGLFQ